MGVILALAVGSCVCVLGCLLVMGTVSVIIEAVTGYNIIFQEWMK